MTHDRAPLDYAEPKPKTEPVEWPYGYLDEMESHSEVMLAWVLLYAVIVVLGLFVAAWLVLSADRAEAHDAPTGWSYPFSCCSGYDCREVQSTAIGERPEGYVIKGTGEVVGYADIRVRVSPDGMYHWCSVAGANDGRTICLFAPPRSF